ncbi:MAG TPA: hypothetical protein ENK44_12470 [Caldithrix abyssi]|uniref:Uncharacterized protein n=1 Tax=Caldithrix abyssi TaxID=187145 RepID=A0A7V4U1W3_CALAY|nr:hypothetical protein [Caldithrix abyssi]
MIAQSIPLIVGNLIFAAHLLRFYGLIPALIAVAFTFTLLIRKEIVLLLWQLLFTAAGLIWVFATIGFIRYRLAEGLPWLRLLIIMSLLIALAVFNIFWIRRKAFRDKFFPNN